MNKMLEINWRPGPRVLRQFGFIALAAFGLLALLAWREALVFSAGLGAARAWVSGLCAGIAGFSGLAALFRPRANLPLYLGLTVISYPIGAVLSYVIMAVLFYLIVAPIALAFRLLGRDLLHRRPAADAGSYWVTVEPQQDRASYFRQF